MKESKTMANFLDLVWKLWNMRVTVIPIAVGAFGIDWKGLEKRLEDEEIIGWTETIQTTAMLRLARILRRVLENWEELLSLKRQPANAGVKNSQGFK